MFRLERERRIGGKVEREVAYGITSLPRERAAAKELLELMRAHWEIENGLHGRRDGSLREDASRIRMGSSPQVMARLRNLVVYLRPWSGRPTLAAAIRHHMCHPEKALDILSNPK